MQVLSLAILLGSLNTCLLETFVSTHHFHASALELTGILSCTDPTTEMVDKLYSLIDNVTKQDTIKLEIKFKGGISWNI